jgi:hypothetical protein
MDMEGFSQLVLANLTSCHFSLFLYFTPLYISLIYGVFLNKALQVFDEFLICDTKDGIAMWHYVFHPGSLGVMP